MKTTSRFDAILIIIVMFPVIITWNVVIEMIETTQDCYNFLKNKLKK